MPNHSGTERLTQYNESKFRDKTLRPNTLEGLPFEVKIRILKSLSGLSSVKHLILASPLYYIPYKQSRSEILYHILLRLHNGEVDFYEVVVTLRSKGLLACDPINRDKIYDLLDLRRRGKAEMKTVFDHDSFTVEEIVTMLKYHEAAVYFTEDYGDIVPLPPNKKDQKSEQVIFTPTERARFFRAFYRLQTWCHIFGEPECCDLSIMSFETLATRLERPSYQNRWMDQTFGSRDVWRMIWGTIPPWELEEVGCVQYYIDAKYRQCLSIPANPSAENLLFDGLNKGNIEWVHSPSAAESDLENLGKGNISSYEDHWSLAREFRCSLTEIGPYFLYRILHSPNDLRQIYILNNIRQIIAPKLTRLMIFVNEKTKIPFISPADRYDRKDLDVIIASWPVLDRPNAAWTKHWSGMEDTKRRVHPNLWLRYRENYKLIYPIEHMREWEWGYVLWDNERLHEWCLS